MTTVVDARGVLCPVPIIRLARAAAALPPGSLVALLSDDPAAQFDVPAWCHLRDHELVSTDVLEPDDADLDAVPPAGIAPTGPEAGSGRNEPVAPNPHVGPVYRHLIRLGGVAAASG